MFRLMDKKIIRILCLIFFDLCLFKQLFQKRVKNFEKNNAYSVPAYIVYMFN